MITQIVRKDSPCNSAHVSSWAHLSISSLKRDSWLPQRLIFHEGDYGILLRFLARIQTALVERGSNVLLSSKSEKLSEKSGLQNVVNRF